MSWLSRRREERAEARAIRERWYEKDHELRMLEAQTELLKAKNRARELDNREARLRLEREKWEAK